MESFNIKATETIMIGNDPICDYFASINVGCKSILIQTKQSPNFELKEAFKGFDYYQIERAIQALA